jgi:hypothetical protein
VSPNTVGRLLVGKKERGRPGPRCRVGKASVPTRQRLERRS